MTMCGGMDLPDYQRLACELAEAAWKLAAKARLDGDAARAAMADTIAGRAVAMCNDLGQHPPCPPHHPWCAGGCGKRGVAGRSGCAAGNTDPSSGFNNQDGQRSETA